VGVAGTVRKPPVARCGPQVTTLHGERWVDDYFWLRARESPQVRAYLEAENAYTQAVMAPTEALQRALYDEMVGRIQETDVTVPARRGDYSYYRRTEAGRQYPRYVRRRLVAGAREETVLDLNVLARGHDYLQLGIYALSDDHRWLAFGFDTLGCEQHTLRFKDLATGALLEDVIENVGYGLAWSNDGKTVFYTRRDGSHRPDRVLRHVLGTPPPDDETVYRDPDERFHVSVDKTRSGRFIVIESASSVTTEHRVLDAEDPEGSFRSVRQRVQGVECSLAHHGDHFYLRTNAGAKEFRLERVPVNDPEAVPEEVIAHRPGVTLEGVQLFAHHMVIFVREAGLRRLFIRRLDTGETQPVPMPEAAYTVTPGENLEPDSEHYRFEYTSLVTPRTVYDVNFASLEVTARKRDAVLGGYDPSRYETLRLFARADDGVAVPVTLLRKKPVSNSGEPGSSGGPSPCLLYGYGSYGMSIDPVFSATRLSLIDRGFVFALAHVRGGGMLGESWHDQGKLQHKRNTFSDFIAVAEHLIERGDTAAEKLVIQGGSAGGLLVGTVLNMRPELFHAAVAQVPFVDVVNTMLDESIPLTVGEFEEWGNPRDPEAFRLMRSYAPYDNVRGHNYPHLLVTAGLNDPRVQYWEPAKWVAKLRALGRGRRRLLLHTNMGAGHGGPSGRYQALEELALIYAFMLDCVGIHDPQAAVRGQSGDAVAS